MIWACIGLAEVFAQVAVSFCAPSRVYMIGANTLVLMQVLYIMIILKPVD